MGLLFPLIKGESENLTSCYNTLPRKKSTEHGTALLIQTKKTCLTQNCPTFSGFSDVDHHGNRQLQLL